MNKDIEWQTIGIFLHGSKKRYVNVIKGVFIAVRNLHLPKFQKKQPQAGNTLSMMLKSLREKILLYAVVDVMLAKGKNNSLFGYKHLTVKNAVSALKPLPQLLKKQL